MKNWSKFIYIVLLISSCTQVEQSQDVIKTDDILLSNEDCLSQALDFYPRFDYLISKYYEVSRVESKDLDKNGFIDSVAILTPLGLLPRFDNCMSNQLTRNRVLLINLMDSNGKILKKFKFNNVISNDSTYEIKSGEEYIDVSNEYIGFVLFQDYGQGCYVQYYNYVNYSKEKSEFVIDSLIFKSACPSDSNENIIKYYDHSDNIFLKEFDRSIIPKKLLQIYNKTSE